VQRVRVRDGVATGVEAVVRHPAGSRTELTVDARVVVAGAGIESLALLLRSGIGVPRSAAT
jgi:choline dehydrogenase-like flavoprotein